MLLRLASNAQYAHGGFLPSEPFLNAAAIAGGAADKPCNTYGLPPNRRAAAGALSTLLCNDRRAPHLVRTSVRFPRQTRCL
jgi:hypothetical protein